jgi:hypothetical protein
MSSIISPTRRWFALGAGATAAGAVVPAAAGSIGAEFAKTHEWRSLVAARAMADPSRAADHWQALDEFERSILLNPPGSVEELRLAVSVARRVMVEEDYKRGWAAREVVNGAARFFGIETGETPPETIV